LAEALALRDDMEHMAEGLREKIAETKLGQALQSFEEDAAALSAAIDRFVLERYSAGEGYEDANWKLRRMMRLTSTLTESRAAGISTSTSKSTVLTTSS
jgi:hypothetical protein